MGEQATPDIEADLLPTTVAHIELLRKDPARLLQCIHDDGPAVGIYESPRGCAVFSDETQPLCPQHVINHGAVRGLTLIVDLTAGAQLTERWRAKPLFYIAGEAGQLVLAKWKEHEPTE